MNIKGSYLEIIGRQNIKSKPLSGLMLQFYDKVKLTSHLRRKTRQIHVYAASNRLQKKKKNPPGLYTGCRHNTEGLEPTSRRYARNTTEIVLVFQRYKSFHLRANSGIYQEVTVIQIVVYAPSSSITYTMSITLARASSIRSHLDKGNIQAIIYLYRKPEKFNLSNIPDAALIVQTVSDFHHYCISPSPPREPGGRIMIVVAKASAHHPKARSAQ